MKRENAVTVEVDPLEGELRAPRPDDDDDELRITSMEVNPMVEMTHWCQYRCRGYTAMPWILPWTLNSTRLLLPP